MPPRISTPYLLSVDLYPGSAHGAVPPPPVTGSHPEPAAAAANGFPFTEDQFAIAMVFVGSLPEGQTIDGYVAELQRRIRPASEVRLPALEIDAFGFWKEEYNRIRQEKKRLEEKVFLFENDIRYKTRTSKPKGVPRVSSQESETDSEDDRQEAGSPFKRHAPVDDDYLEAPALQKMSDTGLLPQADDAVYKLNIHVFKLGRSRARLLKLTKSTSSLPEIEELASFASQVLSILDTTLNDCFLAVYLLKVNDGHRRMLHILTQISDQVILSFRSSFGALNEICRTILGRQKKGKLIYQMIMFFNKALDLLHSLSSMQYDHEELADNRYSRRKRARVEETEYAANKYLARTIANIIYDLEWTPSQSVHSELLEGILYVVLNHTGNLLSEAVFDEHVAASKNPGNITENGGGPVANGASKYEMRYLVPILHNALGGFDKKDLFLDVLAAGKSDLRARERLGGAGTISVPPGNLLAKAKVLLQSTLVKSALGCDELDTLQLPVPAEDPEPLVGESTEVYGSDWFLEQVWSLIGWDLVV